MHRPWNRHVVPAAVAALLASPLLNTVQADTGHADQRRQGSVHVHGLGTLNIVLEDGVLALDLQGPGANFVGFEHRPRNTEQEQTLNGALRALEAPERLYALPPAARCTPRSSVVRHPDYAPPHSQHQGDRSANGSDHEHGHGHDHDHEHDHGAHSEMGAYHEFDCEHPDRLDAIEVRVFDTFLLTEELQVNILTPELQTFRTLRPDRTRIPLR